MKPKHSPGPWHSAETVSGKLLIVYDREPGFQQTVAELKGKTEHVRADAMLLRAAPELLDIIVTLRKAHNITRTWAPEFVARVDAALKNAGGAE